MGDTGTSPEAEITPSTNSITKPDTPLTTNKNKFIEIFEKNIITMDDTIKNKIKNNLLKYLLRYNKSEIIDLAKELPDSEPEKSTIIESLKEDETEEQNIIYLEKILRSNSIKPIYNPKKTIEIILNFIE